MSWNSASNCELDTKMADNMQKNGYGHIIKVNEHVLLHTEEHNTVWEKL